MLWNTTYQIIDFYPEVDDTKRGIICEYALVVHVFIRTQIQQVVTFSNNYTPN